MSELNPINEFEIATREHFKALADRLTLSFIRYDDRFFAVFAAGISVNIYFFDSLSSARYNVVIGIAPQNESKWNPSGERGLRWFMIYLGFVGMPEDGIMLIGDIAPRVEVLSKLTGWVIDKIFSTGSAFWPPFYAFVQAEIAKKPKPAWIQKNKLS